MNNKMTPLGKRIDLPVLVLLIVIVSSILHPLSILSAPPDEATTDTFVQSGLQAKQPPPGKAVAVPKVVGMSINQARLTLEKVGLRLKLAHQPAITKHSALVGKVAKQHPAAHSHLSPGNNVVVVPYVLKP
jgi:hypothetical protein